MIMAGLNIYRFGNIFDTGMERNRAHSPHLLTGLGRLLFSPSKSLSSFPRSLSYAFCQSILPGKYRNLTAMVLLMFLGNLLFIQNGMTGMEDGAGDRD